MFSVFHNLADNVKQNSYLMGLLSVCEVNCRRQGSYTDAEASHWQAKGFFVLQFLMAKENTSRCV